MPFISFEFPEQPPGQNRFEVLSWEMKCVATVENGNVYELRAAILQSISQADDPALVTPPLRK